MVGCNSSSLSVFRESLVIALCTVSVTASFLALNTSFTYTKELFPTVAFDLS